MIIQYGSDLHLEFEKKIKNFNWVIKPIKDAEVLILAGDICDPRLDVFVRFMKYCVDEWKYVIMISGNHEYYNSSIKQTDLLLEKFSKEIGFHYLNNKSLIIDKIKFIGSTLWSEIPDEKSV